MEWVAVTPATVWDVLPTAVQAQFDAGFSPQLYAGQVTSKDEWLALVLPNYVAQTRAAIAAVPAATLDADTTKIPWPLVACLTAFLAHDFALYQQPGTQIPPTAEQLAGKTEAEATLATLSDNLFAVTTGDAEPWISVTPQTIATEIPNDVWNAWQALLLTKPSEGIWFYEMLAGMVQEFRDSIATNPKNTLDPDTTKIPSSCLHPLVIMLSNAMLSELGTEPSQARRQEAIRAEMFLRQISYNRFAVQSPAAPAASNAPSYTVPSAPTPERVLP